MPEAPQDRTEADRDWAGLWTQVQAASPADALAGVRRLSEARWFPSNQDEIIRFNVLSQLADYFSTSPEAASTTLIGQRVSDVWQLRVEDTGRFALALTGEGRAFVCTWPEAEVIREVTHPHERRWHLLPAGPHLLASSDPGGVITTWDLPAGTPAKQLAGHRHAVMTVNVLADGTWLSGAADGEVIAWHGDTGMPRWRLKRHASPVLALLPSPKGDWGLSWHEDGSLVRWSLADGCFDGMVPGTEDLHELDLTPDGRLIVGIRHYNDDVRIDLREAPGGAALKSVLVPEGLRRLLVNPAGTSFVLSTHEVEDGTWVFSLPDGECRATIAAPGMTSAFSPDGRFWVDACFPTATVWDGFTYEKLAALAMSTSSTPVAIAFSPDARYLAVGEAGEPLRVWAMQDVLAPSRD